MTRVLQVEHEVFWVLVLILARLQVEYMIVAEDWGGDNDGITRVMQLVVMVLDGEMIWALILIRLRMEYIMVLAEEWKEVSSNHSQAGDLLVRFLD